MKTALAALALSYAIFFSALVATERELPARLASHFDLAGRPNGWMERGTYADVMIALAVIAPAILIGCASLVWILLGRLEPLARRPPGAGRDDPEPITTVVLRYVIGYGALLVLFLTGMHLLVVVANASTSAPLLPADGLGAVVGAFLVATLVWSVFLCRRCVRLERFHQ